MSLDNHISSLIKSCFAQFCGFRRIRPLKSFTVAITLANSFIHYRNNLFHGLSNYSIQRLQKVQNTSARLSLVVSVHHTSPRFLILCIGYLLTTVLILRFIASLIVRCLFMNLIILVCCSAFVQILIPFIFPLYHTSIKNHMVFVHFNMLHLIFGIIYLIISVLHQPICSLEKI